MAHIKNDFLERLVSILVIIGLLVAPVATITLFILQLCNVIDLWWLVIGMTIYFIVSIILTKYKVVDIIGEEIDIPIDDGTLD
jgi:hypothetical protein